MQLIRRTTTAFLVTLALFGTARINANEPDFIATVLPQETMAMIRVADWKSLREKAGKFPMGKIYNMELMRDFRKEVETKGSNYLLETFGVDLSKVNQMVGGQFVAAIVSDSKKQMSVVSLLETGDNETAERFATATADELKELGIPLSADRSGLPVAATRFELKFREGDGLSGGPLIICPIDRYVVLCRSVEIFQKMMQRWNDKTADGGLLHSETYQASISLLEHDEPFLFHWYVDPIAWAVIDDEIKYAKSASPQDASVPRVPFPRRHGFAGLKAIAGAGWQNPETNMMIFDVQVYAPSPLKEAMKMFDFDSAELKFPPLIQDDVKVATIVRWKLSEILKNIAGVFDDITDAPGAFDATMADLKRFLKVDLPGELMPILGPEIAIMSVDVEDLALDANVVAIEIKDPTANEHKVAKLIYQLLSGDTEARRSR